MRVVVGEFMSLDGVVQAPEWSGGGHQRRVSAWCPSIGMECWSVQFFDPGVMGAVINEFAEQDGVLLQGRRTYQVSAAAWPERSGDPFTDWINRAQKYVVSDTLTDSDLTLDADDDHPRRRSGQQRDGSSRQTRRQHPCLRQLVGRPLFADGGVGRRARPDDRADNPRWGEELVPDRRGGAQVRLDLGPDRCYGCPGLSLPARSLSHRPRTSSTSRRRIPRPDELLRGLGELVRASARNVARSAALVLPVMPFRCLVWLSITRSAQCGRAAP
jgi:hypothetical protein